MNASIQSSLRVMYDNLGPAEFFAELEEFVSQLCDEAPLSDFGALLCVKVRTRSAAEHFRGGVAAGEGTK